MGIPCHLVLLWMLPVGFWFYSLVVLPVFIWGFGEIQKSCCCCYFPRILLKSFEKFMLSHHIICETIIFTNTSCFFLLNNLHSFSNSSPCPQTEAAYIFSLFLLPFLFSFLQRMCSIQSWPFTCFLTLHFYHFILGTSASPPFPSSSAILFYQCSCSNSLWGGN